MPAPQSPLPRLDLPGKSGAWRLRQMAMDGPARRLAFQDLVADPSMELSERLSRMRTLVDLGLWEDLQENSTKHRSWVRRAVGLFEDQPYERAMEYYAQREREEFNSSFLRAISVGQPLEVLHLLIEAGLHLEARDPANTNDTPLLRAVRQEMVEHAELLLQAGANPEVVDALSASPLKLAIHRFGLSPPVAAEQMRLVDLLLAHGADPNSQVVHYEHHAQVPALWEVVTTFNPAIVQRLIDAKASPRREHNEKIDPVFVHVLDNALTHQWTEGMREDFMQVARILLDAGADLGELGRRGMPPLLHAATYGNRLAVMALLELGADPASVDVEGRSLAHHLVFDFEPEDAVVEMVLSRISPQCWGWADKEGRLPQDALLDRTREYGMEDYDTRPWQAIIQHAGLSEGTTATLRPRSTPRL